MGLAFVLLPINALAAGAVAVALFLVVVVILSVGLIRGIRSFPQVWRRIGDPHEWRGESRP